MQHPYQCIAAVNPSGTAEEGFLVAACGPRLISVAAKDGAIASEWSASANTSAPVGGNNEKENEEKQDRPAKRQKLSNSVPSAANNIIKLTVAPNQQYVVAVTEDKHVRVFSIDKKGKLVEMSQRSMPKRPCAIKVLPDNETILVGDKFGDVYSLPLVPSATEKEDTKPETPQEQSPAPEKAFNPSATNLTVHTKRNLKTLEMQLKQKNLSKKKEPLAFEHKLLLGHVSMLTDLAFATREVDGKQRGYIFTADRDEHIRVSRGPPQAHVIEGYCLGHTEFISKICLVPGTDLLVSGGGDDWLGVWDWSSFERKEHIAVRSQLVSESEGAKAADHKVAISGIWTAPIPGAECGETAVLVTSEKSTNVCILTAAALTRVLPHGSLKAGEVPTTDVSVGQPLLDVTYLDEHIILSADARETGQKRLQVYRLKPTTKYKVTLQEDKEFAAMLETLNNLAGPEAKDDSLENLLYGVANLRKRGGWVEKEAGDEED